MTAVTVVGAGFSGLTLAYELNRLGLAVQVIEKGPGPGGLISTRREEFGLVESAANAFMSDAHIEKLFADLGVEFAGRQRGRQRRYVYWNRPRRWPLSFGASVQVAGAWLRNYVGASAIQPQPQESVSQWAQRVAGPEFEQRLLAPALQGIYAGDTAQLSAALVLGSLAAPRARGRWKGSVAPIGGMGQVIECLTRDLTRQGVVIEYQRDYRLSDRLEHPVVLCTSAWAAAEAARAFDRELSAVLEQCQSLPMISVTGFFEPSPKDLRGFGCLFPPAQKFRALGVLFNDCIFVGRSGRRSETWIFGGARDGAAIALSDDDLKSALLRDRARLPGGTSVPLAVHITRWPRAIPHYTVAWERALAQLSVRRPLFLHGNYLGQLGLAKIYSRSRDLAAQIKDLYVS